MRPRFFLLTWGILFRWSRPPEARVWDHASGALICVFFRRAGGVGSRSDCDARFETRYECSNHIYMAKIFILLNIAFWIIFWASICAIAHRTSPVATGDSLDAEQFYITREYYLPSGPGTFESIPMQALRWVQLPSMAVGIVLIPTFRTDDFVLGVSVFIWRISLIMALSFVQWFIVGNLLDRWSGRISKSGSCRWKRWRT